MESSIMVDVVLGALVLLFVLWVRRDQTSARSSTGKVPRGSFGWPLIGETLSFVNSDPMKFVAPRVKKYGPIFKSHLLGVPSIVVTTPDMAKLIYSERARFRASYPFTITALLGKNFLSNCDPARHPFLKRLVHSAMLPESLKHEVGRLESYVVETLDSWAERDVVIATEMREFTLAMAVYFIFGIADIRGSAEGQMIVQTYLALKKAFYAIPINLPGFTWYKALQMKKRGREYISTLIALGRKDAKEGKPSNNLLRALVVAVDDKGKKLQDDEIIDLLMGTLFGAHDTIANGLTWIIKFLTEYPDILKTVVAEQEEIASLKEPGEPLTWEDTRKMSFTQQVIQETLRYPTILQFSARAALEDVEYKGHLIPKGWRVYVMTTSLHLDPANFPSPKTFDPTRFKVAPKPGTYLPFSGGQHICPGNDLAKLTMLLFVHHLTTKFRWESLQPDMGTEFKPFPAPKGGYPIKVYRQVK